MRALAFPGQGSQYVGMGASLIKKSKAAASVFAAAESVLPGLTAMMGEGPESALNETAMTQPAVLTHAYAAYMAYACGDVVLPGAEAGEGEGGVEGARAPDYFLGHSLGEFTAATAAGALAFEDALAIVHQRGKAMQEAVPAGQGMMAALMPCDARAAAAAVDEVIHADFAGGDARVVGVANVNAPSQVVVSGSAGAVEDVIRVAKAKYGVRRASKLPVSAPFHCSLMGPAADVVAHMLTHKVEVRDPVVPLIVNVSASPVSTAHELIEALVAQTTAPVLWFPSLTWLMNVAGVSEFVHLGPGRRKLDAFANAASGVAGTSIHLHGIE